VLWAIDFNWPHIFIGTGEENQESANGGSQIRFENGFGQENPNAPVPLRVSNQRVSVAVEMFPLCSYGCYSPHRHFFFSSVTILESSQAVGEMGSKQEICHNHHTLLPRWALYICSEFTEGGYLTLFCSTEAGIRLGSESVNVASRWNSSEWILCECCASITLAYCHVT